MSIALTYSMKISWSDEDKAYLVHLPEFGPDPRTHGESYEEAAKNGHEVLEMLIESYIADGEALPVPHKYVDPYEAPAPLKRVAKKRPSGKFEMAKSILKVR